MKVYVAQINVLPGNPDANLETVKAVVARAKKAGAELVLFPEDALSGNYYKLGSSMVFAPPSVPPLSGDRNVIGGQKRLPGDRNVCRGRATRGEGFRMGSFRWLLCVLAALLFMA